MASHVDPRPARIQAAGVRFEHACEAHRRAGGPGIMSFLSNGSYRVLDATLSMSLAGRIYVVSTSDRDRRGRRRECLVPADRQARKEVDRQVCAPLPKEALA